MMPLPSLPKELFIELFPFLDDKTLYKCLFVNRYFCKLSIPLIWSEPFESTNHKSSLIINTLLACLNEDEFSSLVPYAINLSANNQQPLFDYGKFVRSINHEYLIENIIDWLKPNRIAGFVVDCRIQGLINVIFIMIMRQGSNLQNFHLGIHLNYSCINFPKWSTFMTHKPGITNLRSLNVDLCVAMVYDNNIIEFLSMVPRFCNGIVNCDLWIDELDNTFAKLFSDIIKSQPLEKMDMYFQHIEDFVEDNDVKKIINALEFRSETLKELFFHGLCFENGNIDLSFISKLECLEYLAFKNCTFIHHKGLFKEKLHLKELDIWFRVEKHFDSVDNHFIDFNYDRIGANLDDVEVMITSFCSETLLKLHLNIVAPETVKAVKESCTNISFLHIKIFQDKYLDLTIPIICELPSLKILHIETFHRIDTGLLVKILGDYLTYVENLLFNFYVDLPSFKYFTKNCKANLKKLSVQIDDKSLRNDYFCCVDNYQRMHNSLNVLKILKIKEYEDGFGWTNEELKIVGSLKNQGVDIVAFNKYDIIKDNF